MLDAITVQWLNAGHNDYGPIRSPDTMRLDSPASLFKRRRMCLRLSVRLWCVSNKIWMANEVSTLKVKKTESVQKWKKSEDQRDVCAFFFFLWIKSSQFQLTLQCLKSNIKVTNSLITSSLTETTVIKCSRKRDRSDFVLATKSSAGVAPKVNCKTKAHK